jgi:UDPglucose 6-dehydrogenase
MTKILVIGTGYVGLTTAVAFSHLGEDVTAFDVNPEIIRALESGQLHIYEAGMEQLLSDGLNTGRLKFIDSLDTINISADFIFLCVQTPQNEDGTPNLSFINSAVETINKNVTASSIVILKSTIPAGAAEIVRQKLSSRFSLVSNPEFMREGQALKDFLEPDRVVIGSDNDEAALAVAGLYSKIKSPIIQTNFTTASLIKYASNAFLALKLSFINEIAALSNAVGGDLPNLTRGIGLDSRIGTNHLRPGPGWGGSCFPKDNLSLLAVANHANIRLSTVEAAIESNTITQKRVVSEVLSLLSRTDIRHGARVAILGLAFKAGTNDVRESPAIKIGNLLAGEGLEVSAFDPVVTEAPEFAGKVAKTQNQCTNGANVLIVLTDWDYFGEIEPAQVLQSMDKPYVFDTRGILDKAAWEKAGAIFYPDWS